MVIRFERPVDVPIEKLVDAVPDYVSMVRRDPDGKDRRVEEGLVSLLTDNLDARARLAANRLGLGMPSRLPIATDLVLLGAGHAHLEVLHEFAMKPEPPILHFFPWHFSPADRQKSIAMFLHFQRHKTILQNTHSG